MAVTKSLALRLTLLWALFFIIGATLSYPTLNRYDPRDTGVADTRYYAAMVEGPLTSASGSHWGYRILTPLLAKPVYWLTRGHLRSWNPVFFALLVVNAAFCASSALLLVLLGRQLFADLRIGLFGAFLFLSNFTVSNLYLSGLVDGGLAFFLIVLVWSVLNRRWWLLPVIGVLGALCKETFAPFSAFVMVGWFAVEIWRRNRSRPYVVWGGAMTAIALITVFAVRWAIEGRLEMPWETASNEIPVLSAVLLDLPATLYNRNILYVFVVIGPLGLLGIRYLPAGWVAGVGLATLVALFLGAGAGAGNNIGRPLFTVAGPMLSLAAGHFLWKFLDERRA